MLKTENSSLKTCILPKKVLNLPPISLSAVADISSLIIISSGWQRPAPSTFFCELSSTFASPKFVFLLVSSYLCRAMKNLVILFTLLLTLVGCTTETRRAEMRGRLQALNGLNRADSVLTARERDEAQELVTFFDAHGTVNEQVLAHYLLGRCYADMHEAPMALHCYQEAISRADTTAADCDFAQLSRVYGQSATIFYQQGLYRNALEYDDLCTDYGWRGKDTLTALSSYAMKAASYNQLQMKDSAILIYKDAIRQLKLYKFNKVAAGFSGLLAFEYLDKRETEKAKTFLEDYERLSGYFNSVGDIKAGREIFYFWKGLYYLKLSKLDSAEFFFRKELQTGKDFNNQNCGSLGLAMLFQQKHMSDSAAKFFAYSYAMNDSCFVQMTTHEVEQAKAMYDYSRQLELAQKEREKAAHLKYLFLLSILFIAIVLFVAVVIGINMANKKKIQEKETERLRTDYSDAISKKEKISKEMEMLRINLEQLKVSEQEAKSMITTIKNNNSQLLYSKEREIAELNENIQKLALRLLNSSKMAGDNPQFALLIEDFHKKAIRKKNTSLPQRSDWEQLVRLFAQKHPEAFIAIGREQTLSPQELRACILLLLKFTNGEIISLLDISSQGMTNIKTRINEKLFGEQKASTLDHRLKEIPIV